MLDEAESRLSLSILQLPRISTSIRVLATAVTVGVVALTAACGGSGTKAAVASPSGWHSSAGVSSSSADAAGLGFYDGNFTSSGMETAAKWLGAPSTVKYAEDF